MSGMLSFTTDEIAAILRTKAINRTGDGVRNRAVFVLQLCTGCRIGEIMGLTVGDVIDRYGQVRRYIEIKDNHFRTVKSKRTRSIEISNRLVDVYLPPYLDHIAAQGYAHKNAPLFPGRGREKPLSVRQIRNIYQTAIDECRIGDRHSTHSCRKTWACNTYDYLCDQQRAGVNVEPLVRLKELGGWNTLEACQRYISDHIAGKTNSQAEIYFELRSKLKA